MGRMKSEETVEPRAIDGWKRGGEVELVLRARRFRFEQQHELGAQVGNAVGGMCERLRAWKLQR